MDESTSFRKNLPRSKAGFLHKQSALLGRSNCQVPLGHQRFADFVGQHKRGLVLHIQIARQLQGGNPLDRIRVQGNRRQIHLRRQLVKRKDRPGRDGKRVLAGLAPPLATGLDEVMLDAAACRTRHSPLIAPARLPEQIERRFIGQAEDLPQGHRAGLGGEQEVLGHVEFRNTSNHVLIIRMI